MAFQIVAVIVFFMLAPSVTAFEHKNTPNMATLLKNIDRELEHLNRTATKNLSETLAITLMTSLLYMYLVLTLYYVILMESEDLFSRLMALFGKIMVVITLGSYVVAEHFLPKEKMYKAVSRLAIVLFILSIIHLAIYMYRSYISWSTISEKFKRYWIKLCRLFGMRNQNLPTIEHTIV